MKMTEALNKATREFNKKLVDGTETFTIPQILDKVNKEGIPLSPAAFFKLIEMLYKEIEDVKIVSGSILTQLKNLAPEETEDTHAE